MPLGTEVGLGPGDVVLDGDPVRPLKRGIAPSFRPMSIVAKRMDEDAIWYGSRPRPRPPCVRRGLSCPPAKGALHAAPLFSVMSIVAHLSYC